MQVLIHACPKRMWYVEGFLVPALRAQGAENIEIWNDVEGRGNLLSCMDSFRGREGDGGTWHIQDDVLLCRDFVARCKKNDEGVVSGFCCEAFGDDLLSWGRVDASDLWHSFQCVRIPDAYARECAEWFFSGAWRELGSAELFRCAARGEGDDTFFYEFVNCRHGGEPVNNIAPNLVEHVDWIVGGSVLHSWRGYLARAAYWDDDKLIAELKEQVRGRVPY